MVSRPPDWLVDKYDNPAPRYTSYPPVPTWTAAVDAGVHAAQIEASAARDGPLSVYVHIPFCRSLCSYCGCNVVISHDRKAADGYLGWVEAEVAHVHALSKARRRVVQIHWGGGTPNFLDPPQMSRLWAAIAGAFDFAPDAEISVELNPATTQVAQLHHLRQLGFNRISFGVQDLNPEVQRAVRRAPVGRHLEELMAEARALGFRGVNFDLIYGLPGQTAERWERTLDEVLALSPDRLAVYAFAFMPESMPHQRRIDATAVPRGKDKLALFRRAYERLLDGGYASIGMDHFARADDELALAQARGRLRRNFQGYTVTSATDVIALGASAISDVGGVYMQNAHDLPAYGTAVMGGRFATKRGRRLTTDDLRRREIIQQLMCNFRVDLGPDGDAAFSSALQHLQPFLDDGLISREGDALRVTPVGRFFVRNIAQAFDAYAASSVCMASGV